MTEAVAWVGLVLIGLSIVGLLYRVVVGPSAPDRVAAIDAIAVNLVAFVVLFGLAYSALRVDAQIYLDLAIVVAIVSFLATAALGRFLVARADAGAAGRSR